MDFYEIYNQLPKAIKDENPIESYDDCDIDTINEFCNLCEFSYVTPAKAVFTYKGYDVKIAITIDYIKSETTYLYAFKTIIKNDKKFKLLALFDETNLCHYNLLGCILDLTEEEIDKIFEIINLIENINFNPVDCCFDGEFEYKQSSIDIYCDLFNLQDCFEFFDTIKMSLKQLLFTKKIGR